MGGRKITKTLSTERLNFNICDDPEGCLCKVSADLRTSSKIVAGEEDIISLGSLRLGNTGWEPSPITTLEVTIDQGYRFQRLGNCRSTGNSTTCNIYIEKNSATDISLEVVPVSTIQPDVNNITVVVKVTAKCDRENNVIPVKCSGENNVNPVDCRGDRIVFPVEQSWTAEALQDEAQKGRVTFWSPGEETLYGQLTFHITNLGPSVSTSTPLYVFIPNHPLVKNTKVEFDLLDCSEGAMERPPIFSGSPSEEETLTMACTPKQDCLVYQCQVPQIYRSHRKKLTVSYQFDARQAAEEEVTRFEVVTSVCVLQSETSECEVTSSVFEYTKSPLDILIDYWKLLVAVGATIIVFIAVLLLAWRFDLFQKVRFVKNKQEKPSTDGNSQEEEIPLN